jgi:tRNA-binding protein
MATMEEWQGLAIATGTIVDARVHEHARKPAYVLRIDFGADYGERTSCAQLRDNYSPEDLVGRQIVAVMNLPPRRVAGVASEVLVLGAVSGQHGVVLLQPDRAVEDGVPIG